MTVKSDTTCQKQIITKGQAVFASPAGRVVKALTSTAAFQKLDIYPAPKSFSAKSVNIGGGIIGKEGKDLNGEIN